MNSGEDSYCEREGVKSPGGLCGTGGADEWAYVPPGKVGCMFGVSATSKSAPLVALTCNKFS